MLELTSWPPYSSLVHTNPLQHFRTAMVEEVNGLMMKQAVVVVPQDLVDAGFYSTYFLVPKEGWWHSPHSKPEKVQCQHSAQACPSVCPSIQSVLVALHPGLASLDLKDAYLHVPIRPGYHCFLRFLWQGTAYQFCSLPFGLSTRVFTKIFQPFVPHLYSLGVVIYVYLVDLLVTGLSPTEVDFKWRRTFSPEPGLF